MIYIFRKEIRKWHTVLWVVFASLALGGLSSVVIWHYRGPREGSVAFVDGSPILLKVFNRKLQTIQRRIEETRHLAQQYGFPVEFFMSLYGLDNPHQRALDLCVQDYILERVQEQIGIVLDEKHVHEKIIKSLPPFVIRPDGSIDNKVYRGFLERMRMTIVEYEDMLEDEMKREVLLDIVGLASYVPEYVTDALAAAHMREKKFTVLKVPFSSLRARIEKQDVSQVDLEAYYKGHKDAYRIPEKRKAAYWRITSDYYRERVTIDDEAIERFYKKNKDTLFRVPPQVKVRRLLIAKESDIGEQKEQGGLQKAQELHAQLIKYPDQFEHMVKEHSQDAKTASKGGVIDFFKKGTYDPIFERTALRLQKIDEISPVVTTKDGNEILQLIQRIPATAKPLVAVQDKIVQTLTVGEAMRAMKSDVHALLAQSRNDEHAIQAFAKQHHARKEETPWLTLKDSYGQMFTSKISKELFAKPGTIYGVMSEGDDSILYQLSATDPSTVPALESIEARVKKDYYDVQTKKEAKRVARTIKQAYFNENKSLAESARQYDLKHETSDWKKEDDEVTALLPKDVLTKAFNLTSSAQLCKARHGDDYYLVTLLETRKLDEKLEEKEEQKIQLSRQERERAKNLYSNGFIASLRRNVTLETNEDLLRATHQQTF